MIKILLIWFLALISIPDYAQVAVFSKDQNFNTRIYDVVENDYSQYETAKCIISKASVIRKKDQIIVSIEASSFEATFIVLDYRTTSLGTVNQAVRVGEPNQIYVISERTKEVKQFLYYYFKISPIDHPYFNRKMPVSGVVVEISNQPICK